MLCFTSSEYDFCFLFLGTLRLEGFQREWRVSVRYRHSRVWSRTTDQSTPVGLAIDRFNNLVVCDCDKARLQIFTLDGKFVNTIEGQHTQLTTPRSVAVSSTGQLFVTDVNKRCVHVYQ